MAQQAIHHPVRDDWLALRQEPVLEPGLAIIDPHHHLWDRPGEHYMLPGLLADMSAGHDVRATVYVQCRSMYRTEGPEAMKPLGEVEFVNGIAAQCASGTYGPRRPCAGIVAGADLMLGADVVPVLEAMQRCAGDRLKGVRNSVAWHENPAVRSSNILPPPGLMREPAFRDGAKRLAALGLTLDVWAYQSQLGELLDLVRAVPAATVVIDHLGGPLATGPYASQRDQMFVDWKARMAALAELPNTVLKLGGLGMKVGGFAFYQAPLPPSSEELAAAWRPYMETAIGLFGADRCMFESNFPVCKGMFGYGAFWNACKRLTAGLPAAEKRALFSGTAARVYRLDKRLAG